MGTYSSSLCRMTHCLGRGRGECYTLPEEEKKKHTHCNYAYGLIEFHLKVILRAVVSTYELMLNPGIDWKQKLTFTQVLFSRYTQTHTHIHISSSVYTVTVRRRWQVETGSRCDQLFPSITQCVHLHICNSASPQWSVHSPHLISRCWTEISQLMIKQTFYDQRLDCAHFQFVSVCIRDQTVQVWILTLMPMKKQVLININYFIEWKFISYNIQEMEVNTQAW